MKTTIKVFVPSCGAWFKAATLNFLPTPKMLNEIVEQIVDAYCEDTMSSVSGVEVIADRKVIKSIVY